MSEPEHWWWLSFADAKLPEGSQFLGAVIIRGHDLTCAVRRAWEKGLNPGGEVQGVLIPADVAPPEKYRERLLTREDIAQFDKEMRA